MNREPVPDRHAPFPALVAIVLIMLLPACTGTNPPQAPAARPVVVPTTTKVADAAARDALESYDPDTGEMRFSGQTPVLAQLELDDVLVSEPSAAAPYGYLRKVKAIRREGGKVVLETTQANLTDAVHSGEVRGAGELKASDLATATAYVEGLTLSPAVGIGDGFEFHAVFSETVIDIEGDGYKAKVRVDGELYFNAGYGIEIGIDACLDLPPVCVDKFEAWVGVQQRASLTVTGEASYQVTREKMVAEYWFDPVCFMLGPVPVCALPHVALYVGASGAVRVSFEYGAVQAAEARLGVRWTDKKGWKELDPTPRFDMSLNQTFKVDAALKASAYTKVEGALLLYGLAGPTVGAKVEVKIDAGYPRDPFWILTGTFSGYYGFIVKFPVIGKVAERTGDLFSVSKEFGRSTNQPPRVTVAAAQVRVEHRDPIDLSPTRDPTCAGIGYGSHYCVGDPEDGTPSFTLTSDKDGPLPAASYYVFATPGLRTITIRATDKRGLTASASFRVDVVNTPPTAYGSADGDTVPATVPIFISAFASDPNSELDCASLRWSVTAPDTVEGLGQGTACYGRAVFNVQGTRRVTLTAVDPDGAVSPPKTFSVMVTAPPPTPVPQVEEPLGVRLCADPDECPALGEGTELDIYDSAGQTLYFRVSATGGSGQLVYRFEAQCFTCPGLPRVYETFAQGTSGSVSRLFGPGTWHFIASVSDSNMTVHAGNRTIRLRYMPK